MKTWFRCAAVVLLATVVVLEADAQMRKGKLGVGVAGGMFQYYGDDYTVITPKMAGGISVTYNLFDYIGLRALAGVGQFGYKVTAGSNGLFPAGGESYTQLTYANVYVTVNLMPNSRFNPFVSVGGGYAYFDPLANNGTPLYSSPVAKNDFPISFGGGFDFFLSEFVSISATGEYVMGRVDWYDGSKLKSGNDALLRGGLEIRYYFFDQGFMTKMLEALKSRYE